MSQHEQREPGVGPYKADLKVDQVDGDWKVSLNDQPIEMLLDAAGLKIEVIDFVGQCLPKVTLVFAPGALDLDIDLDMLAAAAAVQRGEN